MTKVEPPAGDPLAAAAPAWYAALTTGQHIVGLDLKDLDDRAKFDELLADADLLITSMRPSALDRLAINVFPRLRRCSKRSATARGGRPFASR